MRLSELQRALAASLVHGAPPPDGCSPGAVVEASQALVAKRDRGARHLLPRLYRVLGAAWREEFARHGRSYTPRGARPDVDDAWAFGEAQLRSPDATVRRATHDDLVDLRLRYRRRAAGDVRRRWSPWLGVRLDGRRLVLRLPGRTPRILSLRLSIGGR